MYTEEQEALLVKCRELADKVGGQNKAAELLGVNAGALSQLLAHTYAANPARQFEKIAAYFAVKDISAQTWKEAPMRPPMYPRRHAISCGCVRQKADSPSSAGMPAWARPKPSSITSVSIQRTQ